MIETRERRIVHAVAQFFDQHETELAKIDARAHSLPAMVRRHGPAKCLLFLASKEESDTELARCLVAAMEAALGEPLPGDLVNLKGQKLAVCPDLSRTLLAWEAATEAAGWIKMLVDARQNSPTRDKEQPSEQEQEPAP